LRLTRAVILAGFPEKEGHRDARRASDSSVRGSRLGDEQLGIFVRRDEANGQTISFGHAGSAPRYGANADYYPRSGAVAALTVNGDGGTGEAVIAMLPALDPAGRQSVPNKDVMPAQPPRSRERTSRQPA
jgi:hypothetical protein